jgi:hypothetical protein
MFQPKIVEKIKNILYSREFIRKSYRLRDSVDEIVQPDRPQKAI